MPPAPMPHKVRPMLASPVDEPFDRAGWLFEPKWDGFRAIAELTQKGVRLYSRNHLPFEREYAPVVTCLRQLGHEAVLDGEIVVVDEQGKSQFHLLQKYQKFGKGHLLYYVFDLLYLDGDDLRRVPLIRRKELLAGILPAGDLVRLSEHVMDEGIAFFHAAVAHGLEGMVAKDGASTYQEGKRSRAWLKIKSKQRQEAVIGGFTQPRGSRLGLGALVLGVYEGDRLIYIGHTGSGLDYRGLIEMRRRLEALVQDRCPFEKRPATNAPVRWVKPCLVCEVSFQEWTPDGHLRHPIFVGLRQDKPPFEVRRERAQPPPSG